ncbi:MAG: hypothetical protein HN509_03020 [Halobacteriovoraceae bacterium]|jgi:hypothetical protein|nr:hypothetical protein [Halobacteriovoraceae bacterium]MBT5095178.1 hypothetical protein [Halobacteriovoraceae bacterium]
MSDNCTKKLECFSCKKELALDPAARIPKNEECSYCYADMHCCKMCQFYDQNSYNECREPVAERIVEKEKSNFCDFFVLKGVDNDTSSLKDGLADAADALFKK